MLRSCPVTFVNATEVSHTPSPKLDPEEIRNCLRAPRGYKIQALQPCRRCLEGANRSRSLGRAKALDLGTRVAFKLAPWCKFQPPSGLTPLDGFPKPHLSGETPRVVPFKGENYRRFGDRIFGGAWAARVAKRPVTAGAM